MKSPRSTMVCSASADQRIGLPRPARPCAAGRCRQLPGDVDEQPPGGLVHGSGRRQLPHGHPQRLHGVGHHLLMADGDIDVVLVVARRRDGEQRGDRPALDDLEVVVDQAPFDVLRAAEVGFDVPAQPHEPHGLHIRQRRLLLPRWVDGQELRPAGRRGVDGTLLGGDRLATTAPSRTLKTSALIRPETSASPRPKVASTEATLRLPVTGSAVKRTPAA